MAASRQRLLRATLVAGFFAIGGSTILLSGQGSAAARADDVRRGPLHTLDGFFPFEPPATVEAWAERREAVRRRILVSLGLWPSPTSTPLKPRVHGSIDRGDHTIERVAFESLPGFSVTGNLYRPRGVRGRVPAVLFAHGHWADARLAEMPPERLRQEIAAGGERFEQGGRSIFQSLCVQLARMGCVVWQWDMLGDSDARQLTRELVHGFRTQRADMNAAEGWGLFSPLAEARLQNVMGLQTWNAIRSLDFVRSLPEVDPDRIACTGASGGGTQTMLLAALDDRLALSYPVVMVSTAMQGGCTCENASLLRIGTGNVEFAALFAPKPQGMNTANDWTRELATKGFPELQRLYDLLGAAGSVVLQRGEHFPHNYNAVTRSGFYTFLNERFGLGLQSPVIERDYEPLSRAELTVWDEAHPAPSSGDPDFERELLRWLATDADAQVAAAAATAAGLDDLLRPAVEVLVGRSAATAGDVTWEVGDKTQADGHLRIDGVLRNTTHGEEVAVRWGTRGRTPRSTPRGGRSRRLPTFSAGAPPSFRPTSSDRPTRRRCATGPLTMAAMPRPTPTATTIRCSPSGPTTCCRSSATCARATRLDTRGRGGCCSWRRARWRRWRPRPVPSREPRSIASRSIPAAFASRRSTITSTRRSCPAPSNTSTCPACSRPVLRGRSGWPAKPRCPRSSQRPTPPATPRLRWNCSPVTRPHEPPRPPASSRSPTRPVGRDRGRRLPSVVSSLRFPAPMSGASRRSPR
jgi:hypothetical protein